MFGYYQQDSVGELVLFWVGWVLDPTDHYLPMNTDGCSTAATSYDLEETCFRIMFGPSHREAHSFMKWEHDLLRFEFQPAFYLRV